MAQSAAPGFLARLPSVGEIPDSISLLGHSFYDTYQRSKPFCDARVTDLFRGRVGAMIADYPFTTIMRPRRRGGSTASTIVPAIWASRALRRC